MAEENEFGDKLNFDLSKIVELSKKYSLVLFLLLVVVLQFLPNYGVLPWGGVWMRLQTRDLHILDDFAHNSVYNFYKSQVSSAIVQQNPSLSAAEKSQMVDDAVAKFVKDNSAQVDEQVRQTAEFLKDSERYEEGGQKYTMMPDIDPYQYLRLARNYINSGTLGDSVKDGVPWDSKILAPVGRRSSDDWELHPYLLAYMYKLVHFFSPSLPLMEVAGYFPIVFVALSAVFAFLFARSLTNTVGGVFASILLSIVPTAVGRTQWGHADTDAYNLFFPMLISWLFVESVRSEGRRRWFFVVLNCLVIAVYSFAWSGWWYLFDVLLFSLAVQFVYVLLFNRAKLSSALSIFLAYFFGTFFSSGVIVKEGFSRVFNDILGPFQFVLIKDAAHPNLWPNVYTTVAELNSVSLWGAIDSAGGLFFLVIGCIALLLFLFRSGFSKPQRLVFVSFLSLWLVSTIYATTKGVRFAILAVPAVALMFGLGAGLSLDLLEYFNKRRLHFRQGFVPVFVVLLFGVIIFNFGQVESAFSESKNDVPMMNKAWWSALTKIKDNSRTDAIINSWWDFGHHFKYVADRAVTFDGAHQNSPMAHWIGKVLLTSDEDEAVALLRMLDCGSRKAFDEISVQRDNDTADSVVILNHLIKIKNVDDARKYLSQQKLENVDAILNLTHCSPPEDFFITSEDMVGKAGVWAHFGGWDFEKAYAWIHLRGKDKDVAVNELVKKFNVSVNKASQLYSDISALKDEGDANTWISGWPSYLSSFGSCSVSNDSALCDNGVFVNTTSMESLIKMQDGIVRPKFLSYVDKKTSKFTVKDFDNSPVNFGVIFVPSGNIYRAVLASPEQKNSMFTRLFYFGGRGLKYFKPFDVQHQLIGGGDIFVWKIDWNGTAPNSPASLSEVSNKNVKTLPV